ncbi:hypothetical protein SAY87_013467 [Trapa incisa]|uniref:Uncharacterized protein n=1 Tax=Trapa incisa TaxID=236973 RepID=A0AAN7QD52_9MYRT|nr:hypothetical protein SAY87_013467 [Trapa incisa]
MGGDLGYAQCWNKRGFQLHQGKRLSVKTFRRLVRLSCLVQLLSRWRRALRWGICLENDSSSAPRRCKWESRFMIKGSSRNPAVAVERSYMISNSFYSEAIEECLEFIRRNSVSAQDQDQDQERQILNLGD